MKDGNIARLEQALDEISIKLMKDCWGKERKDCDAEISAAMRKYAIVGMGIDAILAQIGE